MKAQAIVEHLWNWLPQFSGLFNQRVAINSIVVSGSQVTISLATPHGLKLSEATPVRVGGVKGGVGITQATFTAGAGSMTLAAPHNMTSGWPGKDSFIVTGVPGLTSGTMTEGLTDTSFRFLTPAVGSGAGSGGILFDGSSGGHDGVFLAIPTGPNTLVYSFTGTAPATTTLLTNATVSFGFRISAGVDRDRLLDAYTTQKADSDWWAFVILQDVTAGKDQREGGDALKVGASGVAVRQRLIFPFEVMVVARATNSIAGRLPRDTMQEVRAALIKSLCRASFPTGFAAEKQYQVVYSQDALALYDGSVYAHTFLFEQVADISQDDVLPFTEDVPFRTISIDQRFTPDLITATPWGQVIDLKE